MTDTTARIESSTELVHQALDFGFSHAAMLDPSGLRVREEVREMCAADRCHSYNRSWACPPACGELDDHRAILKTYRVGLIVQTTGELEDPYDYDTMMALGELQKRRFQGFRTILVPSYPRLLALGNGGCTICPDCTYPDLPCRHPDQAVQSMEAFGLVVSDVCAANQLGYYYGPNTLTYTGCYLLD